MSGKVKIEKPNSKKVFPKMHTRMDIGAKGDKNRTYPGLFSKKFLIKK